MFPFPPVLENNSRHLLLDKETLDEADLRALRAAVPPADRAVAAQ